jgi:hypothetical protein
MDDLTCCNLAQNGGGLSGTDPGPIASNKHSANG